MPHTLEPFDISSPPPFRKKWTRTNCEFLERNALLTERYELIDGEIIVKMGQGRKHSMALTRLFAWLIALFGETYVQSQTDIEVVVNDQETNRPQPDVAVLKQPDYKYTALPMGLDLNLVAEVSDTTLADDLKSKAALYARNNIIEYWVLDVRGRRLIIHRAPSADGYSDVKVYQEIEEVATLIMSSHSTLVSRLLPPVALEEASI